jgi:hypothetical protein
MKNMFDFAPAPLKRSGLFATTPITWIGCTTLLNARWAFDGKYTSCSTADSGGEKPSSCASDASMTALIGLPLGGPCGRTSSPRAGSNSRPPSIV